MEWAAVAQRSRASGAPVQMGQLFGMRAEKKFELPQSDLLTNYRYMGRVPRRPGCRPELERRHFQDWLVACSHGGWWSGLLPWPLATR
jgi:hypothetical protein